MCAQLTNGTSGSPFEDEFVPPELVKQPELRSEIGSPEKAKLEKKSATLPATLDSLPEDTKAEVLHRLSYIQWFEARLHGGWTEKNITPLLAEAVLTLAPPAPSWRTLARWWKDYAQHGRSMNALLPRHKSKGNTKSRLSTSDDAYFEQAVLRHLVSERPSVAASYQHYSDSIRIANSKVIDNPIRAISYMAFYNRIKKLPGYEVTKYREGAHVANVEFKAIRSHVPPSRILERVEIDHTPLDLILLDDELRVPLGRPNLTLLVDAYSHCILGFNLSLNQPGYESVRNALLCAIAPKDYVREKYPAIEHEWPCHGKPECLVVDNGVEFWSESLAQACLELGVHVQYNPVRKPWLKPLIERMFGTINRKLLESIPGKTFSNILQKAGYNPQKDAVMRFSSFLEIFHKWIIDVYHREPDSRQRYIPYRSWQHGYDQLPPAQIVGEDLAVLEVILSISFWATHRRGGIQHRHLRYDSVELAGFRMKYPDQLQGNKKVLVKLNPRDVSYVYVFIDEIDGYLRVPCIDAANYTHGLSLQQHLINLKLQRDFIGENIDVENLSKARIYIQKRIDEEVEAARGVQKPKNNKGINKIAKYMDVGSQSNTTISAPAFHLIGPTEAAPNVNQSLQDDDWDNLIADLEPY